jgi:hypothetical protein
MRERATGSGPLPTIPTIAPHLEFVDVPTEKTDTISVAPTTVEGGSVLKPQAAQSRGGET